MWAYRMGKELGGISSCAARLALESDSVLFFVFDKMECDLKPVWSEVVSENTVDLFA